MNNNKKEKGNKIKLPCLKEIWNVGYKIGRILSKCIRSILKLLVGLIVLYAIFLSIPDLRELMPGTSKLIEVILNALDNWLTGQWFMARWF